MSNQKKSNQTSPAAETEAVPAEVVSAEEVAAATTLATTPPATTALAPSRPGFDASSFEERIAEAGGKLRQLALDNPDLKDNLEELAMYAVARVEGIEGNRGVMIPNISVRQQMTKSESLPGDVKVGELYTKQEPLGPSVTFIPLFTHFKRVKFVQGQERPECFSDDGVLGSKWGECARCPHGKYVEGERTACSSGYSFAVVTEDLSRLYQVDFIKTSSKTGKRLMNLASSPHGIFKHAFTLFTEKEKNSKGEFYVLRVNATGRKTEGPRYEAARALFQFFKARFDLQVERRRAGGDKTAGGGMINGNPGGSLPSGEGGNADPDFSEGL